MHSSLAYEFSHLPSNHRVYFHFTNDFDFLNKLISIPRRHAGLLSKDLNFSFLFSCEIFPQRLRNHPVYERRTTSSWQ